MMNQIRLFIGESRSSTRQKPKYINCGVRQGKNLSPVLFSLFSLYLIDLEEFLARKRYLKSHFYIIEFLTHTYKY